MKSPKPIGTPIDMLRFRAWRSDFTSYRHQVTEDRINRWLEQFAQEDRDLAARVLDCVDFINREQMSAAFRSLLTGLPSWLTDPLKRHGKWRFVAYSATAGESGDEMLHVFRIANSLAGRPHANLFTSISKLLLEKLGSEDTVVFVDDFSGTGNQVCDYWTLIQELLPDGPKIYLLLVVAGEKAVHRIENETDIICLPYITLKEEDNIFSEKCTRFSQKDKERILHYCKIADRRNPRGYCDCGYLVVFSHTCPNNSIPILHACSDIWEGLFRRYD